MCSHARRTTAGSEVDSRNWTTQRASYVLPCMECDTAACVLHPVSLLTRTVLATQAGER